MSAIIRLEPKQSRRVNALVRRERCNYDNGNCILLDCTCPQTITYSHIICKWFKTAVLPLDKELHIELMKPKNTRVCTVCGAEFTAPTRKFKYCDNCRKIVIRKQKAEYQRKKRLDRGKSGR